jgi:hypothetical protein
MAPPALRPSEQTPARHGMPARSSVRRRLPQTEPSSLLIATSRFDCRPAGENRVRPGKAIGSPAAGVERHHLAGNEPCRRLPRLMDCGGPCGPRGK